MTGEQTNTQSTDVSDQLERAITCAFNANDMNNVARLLEMKIDLLRNPVAVGGNATA